MKVQSMNVGTRMEFTNLWGKVERVEPSAKAKTVKIGMKFNGPYQYLDTSAGEMRQTMPTFTRDEILLQAGLLKHAKLQRKIANVPLSRLRRFVTNLFT